MANRTRIPKTQLSGIYGGLVTIMTRRMLGEAPESAEVMWHFRAVFKDLVGFCLDLGYFTAHNGGLDGAKAREVPRWRESWICTPLAARSAGIVAAA